MLLRAALLQDAAAVEAWHSWRASVDFDHLEAGAFALLPLLYHNLHHHNIRDPWLVKCKGIYRRTWSQNQLSLQQLTALVHTLHGAQIKPVLLADTALLLAHYPDYGLRTLPHIDIATALEPAAHVLQLFQQAGWRPQSATRRRLLSALRPSQIYRFQHAQRGQVMLQWHIMPHDGYPQGEDDLWQTAKPVVVNHEAALTQSATDLLLAVCTQERPRHSVQWIADASMLLQGADTIDWNHLLRRVAQQALSLRMHHALAYLHEVWHVPVPIAILQQLAAMSVQPFEQWEAQLYQQSPSTSTKVRLLWAEYQRRQWWAQQVGLDHKKVSLSQYLQQRFQLDSPWQIPLHLGKASLRQFSWIGNHDSPNHNSTMGQKASE